VGVGMGVGVGVGVGVPSMRHVPCALRSVPGALCPGSMS
jgi:hypothetical protein